MLLIFLVKYVLYNFLSLTEPEIFHLMHFNNIFVLFRVALFLLLRITLQKSINVHRFSLSSISS